MFRYFVVFFVASAAARDYDGSPIIEMCNRACENYDINLQCPSGMYIDIVDANYGRVDSKYCLDRSGTILSYPLKRADRTTCNKNCWSMEKSTEIMKERCNNQNSCTVTACNRIFGDPCRGTYKYLAVKYRCVSEDACTSMTRAKSYLCEHFDSRLICPSGKKIRVQCADYGRSNNELCLDYPRLTGTVYQTGRGCNQYTSNCQCHSSNTTRILQNMCNNRNVCWLTAENCNFGDPCYGTYKYLSVDYTCV